MKRHALPLIGDLSVASMASGTQGDSKYVIKLGAVKPNPKIWRFYIRIASNVSHGVFTCVQVEYLLR